MHCTKPLKLPSGTKFNEVTILLKIEFISLLKFMDQFIKFSTQVLIALYLLKCQRFSVYLLLYLLNKMNVLYLLITSKRDKFAD